MTNVNVIEFWLVCLCVESMMMLNKLNSLKKWLPVILILWRIFLVLSGNLRQPIGTNIQVSILPYQLWILELDFDVVAFAFHELLEDCHIVRFEQSVEICFVHVHKLSLILCSLPLCKVLALIVRKVFSNENLFQLCRQE